ncbi:MAG TPA: type VI secretion system protein TssA [Bryobacteraceae bacterium]|nr:type VI secretion system protein TssA [Bryobacteraceae bacterium]
MATVEELLNPIPGPSPSGENVRYAPAFDKLKEARRPGGDWLSDAVAVDYSVVAKHCEDFLLKKTKDLQIAVWLTEAWLVKQGFSGFQNGLLLIKGMMEKFWDTLYPELEEDGDTGLRLAPIDWLGGYLDLAIKKVPLSKGGHNLIQYKESQMVGPPDPEKQYEDPEWENKKKAYDVAVAEGKLTSDVFDAGFQKTPKDYYVQLTATVASVLESLDSLNTLCEEKFSSEPPSFSKIRVALEEIQITANSLLEQKRKLEPDPEDVTDEQTSEATDDETSEETAEETVTVARVKKKKKLVGGIEPESHEEAGDRVSAVANWLRAQDPQNPSSYSLLRGYRWGELRASGSTAPDQMLLEPPATEVRTGIKKLSLEGNWEELLRAGEEAMGTTAGRGWLDLQRYTVTACENLYYTAAAAAIKSALKSLLTDMPDMLHMTMMDDTPVANGETMAWIKDNILPPPAVQQEQAPPEHYMPEPEPEPMPAYSYSNEDHRQIEERPPDAFDLAQEALRSGNKEQAVEILVREMAQERSGRAKFNRKMQLAQICLSIGRQIVARPILEELAAEIEKRRLDEWEPAEMVAHTLALLYRCMDDNDRKQQIYGFICRLDPVQAIACLK